MLRPRKISEWMEAGGVAAAIELGSGKIYTGICGDGACTLGIVQSGMPFLILKKWRGYNAEVL